MSASPPAAAIAARGRRASATASARRCATSASRPRRGELVAIIGPNGAGKTTLLSILAGVAARRRAATVSRAAARGRLGAAAAGALLEALGGREPAAVRAAGEGRRRRRGRRRGCSSRPACATAPATRSARSRAATASASTSPSACSPTRRCCCSTSRRRRWTRASASACGSSSAASPRAGTAVVFSTHDVGEAERYADRVLVLADGELLFTGTPARARRRASAASTRDFEARVRPLPARARATDRTCAGCCSRTCRSCGARRCWSRCWSSTRSSIALLIGLALSRGPDKPRVAFVNQVPPAADAFQRRRPAARRVEVRRRGCSSRSTRCASTTRAEAIDEGARPATALGALDRARRRRPSGCRARSTSAAASRRRSRCSTTARTRSSSSSSSRRSRRALADANPALAERAHAELAAQLPRASCSGGKFDLLGAELRHPRPAALATVALDAARRSAAAAARSQRQAGAPGDRLRAAGDRQPRPLRSRCWRRSASR